MEILQCTIINDKVLMELFKIAYFVLIVKVMLEEHQGIASHAIGITLKI